MIQEVNKNPIAAILTACLLYYSCSKTNEPDNGPQNAGDQQVKIELISGNDQTDTIGNPLRYPIMVKVTQNGLPVTGFSVQFQASGCNEDQIISTASQPDGTAGYTWSLSGEVGKQSMKVYVLNSHDQKLDSVVATATALSTRLGWHNSGCSLQGSASATAFCKLSSGKLFAGYRTGKTYLRYSDDNGISWNAVKSLGNNHFIANIISSPSDELFAFTSGDGVFYSNNSGQTWSNLGTPPFNADLMTSAIVTPTGKLMVTSGDIPLCISVDKGKTWTAIGNTTFVPQNPNNPLFNNPAEDQSGNLYVVEQQNETIFKSTDAGKTWKPIGEPGSDFSFYIDNNNWFYKSISYINGGVYVSKDNGAIYNQLTTYAKDYMENMSVQSDGNFYYEDLDRGLYSYDSVSKSVRLIFPFTSSGLQSYIIAKNNNIIVANSGKPYIKYYTK
jgi:hypothetical protein